MLKNSRFNPKAGAVDFWNEIRKPTPYRWPILFVSTFPFLLIFWWLSTEVYYAPPEKPDVMYIPSFAPDRTDEEIIASNEANQRLIDEREAKAEELAERKRDAYKALGRATGLDVDEMERRAQIARQEREREEAERRAEVERRQREAATSSESPQS